MDSITFAQETARQLRYDLMAVEHTLGFHVPLFGDRIRDIERALAAAERLTQRKEIRDGVGTSAGDTDRSVELNTVAGAVGGTHRAGDKRGRPL